MLEDNIDENIGELGYDNYFLSITLKLQSMNEIINKLDFTKIKIYKEILNLNKEKIIWFQEWAQNLHRYLIKEDIQIANKYMKRFPISYVIREFQKRVHRGLWQFYS